METIIHPSKHYCPKLDTDKLTMTELRKLQELMGAVSTIINGAIGHFGNREIDSFLDDLQAMANDAMMGLADAACARSPADDHDKTERSWALAAARLSCAEGHVLLVGDGAPEHWLEGGEQS